MIKDRIFTLYDNDLPEHLKEIIRDSTRSRRAGVSCNYINGKYINVTVISEFNGNKISKDLSLKKIITYTKPTSLFEIALCFKIYNYYQLNTDEKNKNDLKEIFEEKFHEVGKYKIISPLLLDTKGWIVWRYQLYSILSLVVEPC